MRRRAWLLLPWLLRPAGAHVAVGPRTLVFPRDHGAHPGARTEWWYVTGSLQDDGGALFGFQITFFRSRTDVAAAHPSRFAAHQLLFAHAALSDLPQRRLRHDQRIARAGFGIAEAATDDTRIVLRDWRLERAAGSTPSLYRARMTSSSADFGLELALQATQAPLLQGDHGFSRKGPRPNEASLYVSEPQLQVRGTLERDGTRHPVRGSAWLDHEWSETLMPPEAVGWDWIGINLDDGGALMAFRLRRADGSSLWSGGSHRAADGTQRGFEDADAVRFEPGRRWTSPASGASYPVQWRITTPAGAYELRALLDAQELDSRASTGSIYWEGLSELSDAGGRRVGRGYLEMTGYASALKP
jgi:predicted secreted hydrolase